MQSYIYIYIYILTRIISIHQRYILIHDYIILTVVLTVNVTITLIFMIESLISRLSEPPETNEQLTREELDKILNITNLCIDNVFLHISDYFIIIAGKNKRINYLIHIT